MASSRLEESVTDQAGAGKQILGVAAGAALRGALGRRGRALGVTHWRVVVSCWLMTNGRHVPRCLTHGAAEGHDVRLMRGSSSIFPRLAQGTTAPYLTLGLGHGWEEKIDPYGDN